MKNPKLQLPLHLEKTTNLVKYILQLILRQSRTFHILDRTQLLCHPITILLAHGLHLLFGQLLAHRGIISQIGLGADNQAGHTGTVVMHFGKPFLSHVLK